MLIEAQNGSLTVAGTDYTAEVREISVTGGDRDLAMVPTWGFNEYVDLKPITSPIECAVTTVAQDTDFMAMWLGGMLNTAGTGSAVKEEPPTAKTVLFDWYASDGSKQLQLKFASAYGVSHESRMNTEDYMEETTTFKCPAKWFKAQYTADRTTNAIPA